MNRWTKKNVKQLGVQVSKSFGKTEHLKVKKKHPEYELQKLLCKYISIKYPNVLFLSDTVASIKLTIPQQVRNKAIQKKGFNTPDLIILEPNNNYNGLLIELKIKTPFKKDGSLLKEEHLESQNNSINELNKKGYYATFAWSFDMASTIIDNYLKNK